MIGSLLRIVAAASSVPLAALAVLVWTGDATPGPAFIAGAAVVAGALFLALVWTGDLRELADRLRLAAIGAPLESNPPRRSAFVISAEVLGEVAFVSQTLGARADEGVVGQALAGQRPVAEREILLGVPALSAQRLEHGHLVGDAIGSDFI